jgi:hypothetical protein
MSGCGPGTSVVSNVLSQVNGNDGTDTTAGDGLGATTGVKLVVQSASGASCK